MDANAAAEIEQTVREVGRRVDVLSLDVESSRNGWLAALVVFILGGEWALAWLLDWIGNASAGGGWEWQRVAPFSESGANVVLAIVGIVILARYSYLAGQYYALQEEQRRMRGIATRIRHILSP